MHKKTTCYYWLQNPMPVIMMLADVRNGCLYYTNVRDYIRSHYFEFNDSRSENFTFHVPADSRICHVDYENFKTKEGIQNAYRFMNYKINEMLAFEYPQFISVLQEFVCNRVLYYEHIEHQHADPFLTQSISFYNRTVHIQQMIEILSHRLKFPYDTINLLEVHSKYREMYETLSKEKEVVEVEITELHQRIMGNIMNAIVPVRQLILNEEGSYWIIHNPHLYKEAEKMTVEEFKEHCKWARDFN